MLGAYLGVIVVLRVHGAQQAPGLDGPRAALHLRLQRQHRLAQHPPPEQLLALDALWLGLVLVRCGARLGFASRATTGVGVK